MIFATDQDAIEFVKLNSKSTPNFILEARKYTKELCALIEGECFIDELINKIEKIETEAKAQVRRKYSKDIKDFFARLLVPIQNVFSSTGGVKDYMNGGETKLSEQNQKKLLSVVSNVRDNKSIEKYLQTQWMNVYQSDPAGVQWIKYNVFGNKNTDINIYPTYHSIHVIRTYEPKGQLVERILFEPTQIKDVKIWTLVDDAKQYTILQKGDSFTIDEDPFKTFVHPFGVVPVIINSNLTDKNGKRLSPVDSVIGISKEYARDQSIKTIYKFQQGFPKHWRRAMVCLTCKGNKKNGSDTCKDCGGKGEYGNGDVADVAIIPMPEQDQPSVSGNDIMGYESPDLETWKQFNEELELQESKAYETLWGVSPMKQITKTATEIHYDAQPQINKLNEYADACEWMEWTITEWCANAIDTSKAKDKAISLIVYGRRFILEGIDTIQQKYERAKAAGQNTVVLDAIFDELLTVKFKNDPEWMKTELKKANCEPYLHYSATEIFTMFGPEEAARKIYFQKWWKSLTQSEINKDTSSLQIKFDSDFLAYLPTVRLPKEKPITNSIPQSY